MHCLRRAPSRLISSRSSAFSRSHRAANIKLSIPPPYNFTSRYPSALQVRLNSGQTPADPSNPRNTDELHDHDNKDKAPISEALPREEAKNSVEERTESDLASFEDFYGDLFKRTPQEGKFTSPLETVYIGNLFWDTKAEDLRKHMEKFGTVLTATICHDNRGLSKGFGYVQYTSIDEAKLAIDRQHMKMFQGREIVVQYARKTTRQPRVGDTSIPPSNTLFIGNIPYELTDRDLQEIFADVYNFVDIRIPVDRRQGTCRGFAHAEFIDIEAARAALEVLSKKKPYGRKLNVHFSNWVKKSEGSRSKCPDAQDE